MDLRALLESGPEESEWMATVELAELQAAMEEGALDSEKLLRASLERIAALGEEGPQLRAVLALAPDAIEQARARDEERAAGHVRGPLHGIPVLIKGNIDVAGIENNAGSLALAGNVPVADAPVVTSLREAGAVVLGTANLSEWANFRSNHSSSGWSSVGGQTRNPHVLDRSPCGSSSGSAVAVAAGLTVLAIGTETDGSVVCPAAHTGVVGIKPTLGLVSRRGIIPVAHSQDTAGPIARSVRDAALVLQAIAVRDAEDPVAVSFPDPLPDYAAALVGPVGLEGTRLGVWRGYFGAGADPGVERSLGEAIGVFERLGARIIDPLELAKLEGLFQDEEKVLHTEFKHDIAKYLAEHGEPNGMATLADLIAFNTANADTVMPHFGQETFERAQRAGGLDDPDYLAALARAKQITRGAIDTALSANRLAAILAPTNSTSWAIDLEHGDAFGLWSSYLPAVSGYPSVTVPMGFVQDLPIGLSVFGAAHSEAELLRIAHAFEQAAAVRRPPKFHPTLEIG